MSPRLRRRTRWPASFSRARIALTRRRQEQRATVQREVAGGTLAARLSEATTGDAGVGYITDLQNMTFTTVAAELPVWPARVAEVHCADVAAAARVHRTTGLPVVATLHCSVRTDCVGAGAIALDRIGLPVVEGDAVALCRVAGGRIGHTTLASRRIESSAVGETVVLASIGLPDVEMREVERARIPRRAVGRRPIGTMTVAHRKAVTASAVTAAHVDAATVDRPTLPPSAGEPGWAIGARLAGILHPAAS